MCAYVIMFEDAENGKAVLGTGGVNLLPHMSVFLSYTVASVAVRLAQATMQRFFATSREQLAFVQRRAILIAIATEGDEAKLNKHIRV